MIDFDKYITEDNTVNFLFIIIIICGFFIYYKWLLIRFDEQKIANGILSATHAIGVIILYLWKRQATPLIFWSIPYFVLDSYLSARYSKTKLQKGGLVLHHIIVIYILLNLHRMEPRIRSMSLLFFFLLETSNLPYYLMGQLMNMKYDNKQVLQAVLLIQIITGIIIRLIIVPLVPLLEMDYLNKNNVRYIIGNYLIYLLSIYWTTNLWKQFIIKYNSS
jgi:hypothetical protein